MAMIRKGITRLVYESLGGDPIAVSLRGAIQFKAEPDGPRFLMGGELDHWLHWTGPELYRLETGAWILRIAPELGPLVNREIPVTEALRWLGDRQRHLRRDSLTETWGIEFGLPPEVIEDNKAQGDNHGNSSSEINRPEPTARPPKPQVVELETPPAAPEQSETKSEATPIAMQPEMLTDDDRAVALFNRWQKERRNFTIKEFAIELGVPRTEIYNEKRFPTFLALRKSFVQSLPTGKKQSGRVEAEYHDDWEAIDDEIDAR